LIVRVGLQTRPESQVSQPEVLRPFARQAGASRLKIAWWNTALSSSSAQRSMIVLVLRRSRFQLRRITWRRNGDSRRTAPCGPLRRGSRQPDGGGVQLRPRPEAARKNPKTA